MLLHLFCPKCAYEAGKKLEATRAEASVISVPVPMVRIEDSGKYQVNCQAGHSSEVIVTNLKFELLFEYGLNAIFDGYTREAVSSFVAALERAQEFFWRTSMAHLSISQDEVERSWNVVAKQSERQLGAYVSIGLMISGACPPVLSPHKEVRLRNDVIHGGYMPSHNEAVEFGDAVMVAINAILDVLRRYCPDALLGTYASMSPTSSQTDSRDDDDHTGTVNILTAIDVMHPPTGEDQRMGTVIAQLPRIAKERQPRRMTVLSEAEARRQFPDRYQQRE